MNAEIISVGTELLMGQIVNSDAAFIAKELTGLGIDSYFQTVVGDNPGKIKEVIKIAESRSDLLIFTGGLGPTQDDLTKQTVADHLGEELVMDEAGLTHIRQWFERSGRNMTKNNELQALVFRSGIVFPNPIGQALGTYTEKDGKGYLLLPGPPRELEQMFRQFVKPFLSGKYEDQQVISSKTLRFFGIGESALTTMLDEMIRNQTNPTIAPYAGKYEVTLRLTANAATEAICEKLLDEKKAEILAIVGEYHYGDGDESSLSEVVGKKLLEEKKSISAAESLTGGLFQAELVKVPGISEVFAGGIVSYQEGAKQRALGVPAHILETYGMVSPECAVAMAERARELFDTQLAISFTGVAGPDRLEDKPAGTVWIALSQKNGPTAVQGFRFSRDRLGNREQSVMQGFDMIRRNLLESGFTE
ncbi:competence/damage-inducible protein A [Trichococcus pasteurii]|uniref:Putative competence-damage inducible protein n=2 Tax=root TaxID=1 RepID=A0A1W1ICA5_9LACT|nr:competence/damage-inducible protein A [Trichococcus pasteurii]SFE32307.1 nicotinamide-nucleotide amidase [Trichococcus pasteurii]SLM50697.1 competence-damaged protein [Trichococcus pasteurii]SSB91578.1 competence-damaged protein [Trichococcus pasteurii]